jgi:hypothetical protein
MIAKRLAHCSPQPRRPDIFLANEVGTLSKLVRPLRGTEQRVGWRSAESRKTSHADERNVALNSWATTGKKLVHLG